MVKISNPKDSGALKEVRNEISNEFNSGALPNLT